MSRLRTAAIVTGLGVAALALYLATVDRGARSPADQSPSASPPSPTTTPPDASDRGAPGGSAATEQRSSSSPATVEPGLPLTTLPLRLLATALDEEGAGAFARIEDTQHATDQIAVEGQVLTRRPDVRLEQIAEDHVVLDNYGVLERLLLDPSGARLGVDQLAGEEGFAPTDDERERRREMASRLRELTDAGADYERLDERGGLLADADVSPLYEDGELIGMAVSDVQPGSLYDRAGLRDGDLLRTVNGVRFDEPMAAASLIQQLNDGERVDLSVTRADGSEAVISVELDEIMDELGRQQP